MKTVSLLTLVCAVSLLGAHAARAERVVVLEFKGDPKKAVRGQLEKALKAKPPLKVLPLAAYQAQAQKQRLVGPKAMTQTAVAQVSGALKLNAAVTGTVGKKLAIQVWDAQGEKIWSQEVPLQKGKLSPADAARLARSIVAAAKSAERPDPVSSNKTAEPVAEAAYPPPEPTPSSGKTVYASGKKEPASTSSSSQEEARPYSSRSSYSSPPERTTTVSSKSKPVTPVPEAAPKILTLQLLGSSTFRNYCARPGVTKCSDYNSSAPTSTEGTYTFGSSLPYGGGTLGAEIFPLAHQESPFINGIGVVGYYGRGYSQVKVTETGAADQTVVASDDQYFAGAAYRYHFISFSRGPEVGYVGLRGGVQGRNFNVNSSTSTSAPLAGSHRTFGALGLDFAVPLIPHLRIEGGVNLALGAGAGTQERNQFGAQATGGGWGGDLGLGGYIWGPIGYLAKVRYAHYADAFSGGGSAWSAGGAAEESYLSLLAGLTASF